MSSLYVKMTDACNLSCPFCYARKENAALSGFSVAAVKETVAKYPGITRITLHGGEPPLNPKGCRELIKAFPGMDISITSNLAMSTEWVKDCMDILERCDVATSYSVDRFTTTEGWNRFLENTQLLREKNIPFTLLVTLSEAQMKQDPKMLVSTIKSIGPSNTTFERLYITDGKTEDKIACAERTDNYLTELFRLMPEGNNLRSWMLEALQMGISVFPPKCQSMTLETDGTLIACPNLCGKQPSKKRKRECLHCELYQWCREDCPSFQDVCSFPNNTFKKLKDGEL